MASTGKQARASPGPSYALKAAGIQGWLGRFCVVALAEQATASYKQATR